MLPVLDTPTRLCDGFSRREWLRVGGLGAFGLSLPALQAARANTSQPKKNKACIMIMLLGGPPQQETWDPKPDSAPEYKGDLKPISSATLGLVVGETMPLTAKHTKKIAVLRAVQTRDSSHSSSGYYMTTGKPHAPLGVENAKPGAPNDWPSLGAIVRRLKQGECKLPAAVTLPEQSANDGNLTWPGQDAGWLGRSADPWLLNCDPSLPNFEMPGLGLPGEVPALRFDERRSLLEQMNSHLDKLHRGGVHSTHGAQSQQAFDLISSPAARRAFDLESEGPKARDCYGRTRFGQSLLLARRLVEAGVPLVRINWTRLPKAPNNGHWDTHSQNTAGMKTLMPVCDAAYSALLDDLADRGQLDDTLVVWTGEFGRTPKLNGAGGRDHWGHVFSVALAGGGVKGGTIHGASDKIAAYPKDGRVMPEDLQATIYHCLGIPIDAEFYDTLNRPYPVYRGEVVKGIL
jgi:uncharacterized protein (DUF1501 family)